MLAALAAALVFGAPVTRDGYGVPTVKGTSWAETFEWAGYAVAQDRLWQMELSRRLARGKMAELMGPPGLESDREVARLGQTDEELQAQLDRLDEKSRTAYDAYAAGVNRWIQEARASGNLPKGYADNGLSPEPWSPIDSAAITVQLVERFGMGGAGELRNYAALSYLKTQRVKDQVLDVFDDFLWLNDPRSIPTVLAEDETMPPPTEAIPSGNRDVLERHLAELPEISLIELMPAIRLAMREPSAELAGRLALPHRIGSYAVVVDGKRSATGYPILLSAPQMGFTNPSIAHEMVMEGPDFRVAGMNVPGIPGVLIGATPRLAWGITSGVADVADIFLAKMPDRNGYEYGAERRPIQDTVRTIAVKGGEPVTVTRRTTHYGPVLLETRSGWLFTQASSFRGHELQSLAPRLDLYRATTSAEIMKAADGAFATFNLFFAFTGGDIGYRYVGRLPLRSPDYDPRLPMPAGPRSAWRGYLDMAKMPRVVNPRSGVIVNWNNKPVSWWPNYDTPAWGQIFRNEVLAEQIPAGPVGVADVEMAAWWIARREPTTSYFLPMMKAALNGAELNDQEAQVAKYLNAFEGSFFEGSQGALIYQEWMSRLRETLFAQWTGNFLNPATFRTVAQASVMLDALQGKTRFDYLAGRTANEVLLASYQSAVNRLLSTAGADPSQWSYTPGQIRMAGVNPPIPYSDRGTYIQIVELSNPPSGRSVLPPGVSAEGPHSQDQVPLARAWTYKRMAISGSG